ncbi:hypothetical protein GCM10010840_23230 [Deinococcus aerolatus]|uniref:Uncharacterized protein n=2 Tax=Deinococcus aerolatus TaxID=522487 RepID=A0ABQ2GB87_9DEIO|nr:hypothetical protein GCM10010840_23230 [Deinococcus aerolatus]
MPCCQTPPRTADAGPRTDLRTQAEQQARAGRAAAPSPVAPAQLALDFQFQQHELQVHQIELSLQLEELQRNNAEFQRMRDVYRHLYDLTPAEPPGLAHPVIVDLFCHQ